MSTRITLPIVAFGVLVAIALAAELGHGRPPQPPATTAPAAALAPVTKVELQPLAAQVRRLIEAAELVAAR